MTSGEDSGRLRTVARGAAGAPWRVLKKIGLEAGRFGTPRLGTSKAPAGGNRGLFFRGSNGNELAVRRRVSTSTVYNQKASAQKRLHDDDCFFSALRDLGRVRDRARAESIAERYPDSVLPDGRRIVVIDVAA